MGVLMKNLRGGVVLLCLSALLGLSIPVAAQDGSSGLQLQEQKIKAGLVYNFLKYTTWPVHGRDEKTLRICLYGGDPFDGYLYPLRGRTAQQDVIVITEIDTVAEALSCHLLFVDPSQEKNLPEIFGALRGHNVLTTSDIEGFVRKGGMVEFATQNQRISVYINKNAITAAGLSIDNRLLKFAKLVPGNAN